MPNERSVSDGGQSRVGTVEPAAPATTVGEVPDLGNVLITGGGGFIGSHIASVLARQNQVRVIDTFGSTDRDRLPSDVLAVEGDIRDRTLLSEFVRDADVVMHLAGQVSVTESFERPLESHQTNVEATLQLLELARREDARVVFASSAAIYGEPESVPVQESDPKQPSSPYGIEKLAADQYVRLYGEQYDLPVVPLRFFNVYGPGATGGVVDAFVRRAVNGEPLVIEGDGGQTRDFVHVTDVVRATMAAAETEHHGCAYNVASGDRVTIESLAETVRDRVEEDVDLQYEEPRPGDIRHSGASIERARSQLEYEPRVQLAEGVDTVVDAVATDRR